LEGDVMSDIENPPAFPGSSVLQEGMTLRDWFAGQLFAASIGRAEGLGTVSKEERAAILLQAAEIFYEAADAMLTARGQQ
jgi:hypothetical protein